MTKVVMDRSQDDVDMTFLSVERIQHHVILTLELSVVHLPDLQSIFRSFEEVDIIAAGQVRPLKGKVVVEEDSDGGAKES